MCRDHANQHSIVPILSDDPRKELPSQHFIDIRQLGWFETMFGLPKNFPRRKITQALANKKLSVTQRILLFTLLSAANTNNQRRYIRSVWFIYRKSANTSKYKLYKHKKKSRDGHTHKNSFFHVVGGSQRGLKFPARYEIFVPTNLYATKSSCKNPQICLYYKLLQDTCGLDFPASPINL